MGDLLQGEPGSIRGGVYLCSVANCQEVATDSGLAEVSIRLLNETGSIVSETVTAANGSFEFVGLASGIYAVQEIQPSDHVQGRAYVGSGGGTSFDSNLIGEIVVRVGSQLVDYNFSDRPLGEVDAQGDGDKSIARHGNGEPEERQPEDGIVLSNFVVPSQNTTRNDDTPAHQTLATIPQTARVAALSSSIFFATAPSYGGSSQPIGYAWHLSIFDGGGHRTTLASGNSVQLASTQYDVFLWQIPMLDRGSWTTPGAREPAFFGHPEAVPVVGDWDGDGHDEFGVFLDGDWYLDLNGNGRWDEADLWAQLGYPGDLPVTGDWDADGKTDIGVYGPIQAAISGKPSNDGVNANSEETGNTNSPDRAKRTMRRTALGPVRADVVDHVFHYGAPGDYPVTGDWNGDGSETIAVFRHGTWYLDLDGDGRFTDADVTAEFGQAGDVPVVGDWDGSGIDHLGVYRAGTWILDLNGDQQLGHDDLDRAFELGNLGDHPVVGDWDGDGTDERAIYSPNSAGPRVANRRAS